MAVSSFGVNSDNSTTLTPVRTLRPSRDLALIIFSDLAWLVPCRSVEKVLPRYVGFPEQIWPRPDIHRRLGAAQSQLEIITKPHSTMPNLGEIAKI